MAKIANIDTYLWLEQRIITMTLGYQKSKKLDLGKYACLRLEIVNCSQKLRDRELRRLSLLFENFDRAITARETDEFRKGYEIQTMPR